MLGTGVSSYWIGSTSYILRQYQVAEQCLLAGCYETTAVCLQWPQLNDMRLIMVGFRGVEAGLFVCVIPGKVAPGTVLNSTWYVYRPLKFCEH